MIEFTAVTKRQWKSSCGCYLILATGKNGDFNYSASFKSTDDKYHQLGIHSDGSPAQNAEAAKAACETHLVNQG